MKAVLAEQSPLIDASSCLESIQRCKRTPGRGRSLPGASVWHNSSLTHGIPRHAGAPVPSAHPEPAAQEPQQLFEVMIFFCFSHLSAGPPKRSPMENPWKINFNPQ